MFPKIPFTFFKYSAYQTVFQSESAIHQPIEAQLFLMPIIAAQ
jgi:hypothetical protein